MIDRHRLIKAFWKLSGRDKAVILIFIAVAFGIIFSFIFKQMNMGGLPLGTGVADSTLTDFGEAQQYRQGKYTDLGICVQYPDTSFAVYVGGDVNAASRTGQSFSYGKGMTVFVMETDKNMETARVMESNLPSVLGLDSAEISYKQKVLDTGYKNGLRLEYQGGCLKAGDTSYTIMTYRFEGDPAISLIMGVSCDRTADTGAGKKLLDKVLYTLCQAEPDLPVEDRGSADGFGDAMTPVNETEENGYAGNADSGYADPYSSEEVKKRNAKLDELKDKHEEEIAMLDATPEQYWETNIEVAGDNFGKEMAFVFSYTNTDVTAKEAILSSPNGARYKPSYNNDRLDGRIVFYVESPMEGVWHLKVSLDGAYGKYVFNVLEEQRNGDPAMPNGEREGGTAATQ